MRLIKYIIFTNLSFMILSVNAFADIQKVVCTGLLSTDSKAGAKVGKLKVTIQDQNNNFKSGTVTLETRSGEQLSGIFTTDKNNKILSFSIIEDNNSLLGNITPVESSDKGTYMEIKITTSKVNYVGYLDCEF